MTAPHHYDSRHVAAAEKVGSSWRDEAACRTLEPAIFYQVRDDRIAEAKAICAECPVRAACLAYALTAKEPFGIWGGKTDKERLALRGLRGEVYRKCATCGKTFEVGRHFRRYCSDECKPKRWSA